VQEKTDPSCFRKGASGFPLRIGTSGMTAIDTKAESPPLEIDSGRCGQVCAEQGENAQPSLRD